MSSKCWTWLMRIVFWLLIAAGSFFIGASIHGHNGCWCGGGFSECECKPGTCGGVKCGKGCICAANSECRGVSP